MTFAKDNPFRVECVHGLPFQPMGTTWPKIYERLTQLNHRGAIVGPHGSGKSTCIQHLKTYYQNQGYLISHLLLNQSHPHLSSDDQNTIQQLTPKHILFLDGAERLYQSARRLNLNWLRIHNRTWKHLLTQTQQAAGFIITTHTPSQLPTLFETHTSVELLQQLIAKLKLDHPIDPKRLNTLFHKHHGNIRDIFHTLYMEY